MQTRSSNRQSLPVLLAIIALGAALGAGDVDAEFLRSAEDLVVELGQLLAVDLDHEPHRHRGPVHVPAVHRPGDRAGDVADLLPPSLSPLEWATSSPEIVSSTWTEQSTSAVDTHPAGAKPVQLPGGRASSSVSPGRPRR